MAKAVWKATTLAQSDEYEMVDGNVYFPMNSVNKEHFIESTTHSNCPWKGKASYYNIEVNGEVNKDAAWYYPEAKEKAKNIEGYVAFWKGVDVSE
jgi:uncharacterized protein (DUF427 family)